MSCLRFQNVNKHDDDDDDDDDDDNALSCYQLASEPDCRAENAEMLPNIVT